MFNRLAHRIWRERRRFLVVAVLITLMAALHLHHVNAWMLDRAPAWRVWTLTLVAATLTGLIVGAGAVVLAMLVPFLRFIPEVLALIFAAVMVVERALGLPGWAMAMLSENWLLSTAATVALIWLYLSNMGERLWVLRDWRVRARAHSRQPAEALFDALAMRLDRPDRARAPGGNDLVGLEPLDPGQDGPGADRRLTLRVAGGLHSIEDQRVTHFSPPQGIGYDFRLASAAPDQPNASGHRSYAITPRGRRHRVDVDIRWDRLTWRQALLFWIDDVEGRELDSRIAAIDRPAATPLAPRHAVG